MNRWQLCVGFVLLLPGFVKANDRILRVSTPMRPPTWAILEREVLRASSDASRMSIHKSAVAGFTKIQR